MKTVIMIGKPTHMRVGNDNDVWGMMYSKSLDAAYDPRDVDCLRCRKTIEWRYRMTGSRVKVEQRIHDHQIGDSADHDQ